MPVAGTRALAFEVLRETFERAGHTELAFRAGAEWLGLGGRDRAQAQRLAYGSVQRKGTSDAAIEKLSGRAIRLLDPPVAAACASASTSCCSPTGPPTTPPSTRRWS